MSYDMTKDTPQGTEYSAKQSVAGEKSVESQPAASFVARRFDFPGCGLAEEDAETAAAAARLRSGRLCYRALKRAFDVAFSLAVLVALSWLFHLELVFTMPFSSDTRTWLSPVVLLVSRKGMPAMRFCDPSSALVKLRSPLITWS